MIRTLLTITALLGVALLADSPAMAQQAAPANGAPKAATPTTARANEAVAKSMTMNDRQDTEDATRGKLAELSNPLVKAADGRIVWDTKRFDFLKGDAPATVNPSLWRQQVLNAAQGLFEVTDGVYQIRGYDIANMTLVEGASGWIVIDTLLTAHMAKAGLKLAMETLKSSKPVVAVIYTHRHADHYGGVRGVVDEADVHDRALNLANQGQTDSELGNAPFFPKGLAADAASRGYYGTLSHNLRAVYNFHLGFYDANPATLHRLPRVDTAKRYVAAMGGEAAVIAAGRKALADGDYRAGHGDADEMLIKAQLVTKISEIIKSKGLTQTQAAELLGMPQPKLSNLLSGRFRGFSERRLMDCLVSLGRDVQIVVKAAPRSRGNGRLCLSNARPREADAELVLVSRDPDARRAADVVGVVTPAALAHLLKTDEELL